ncbi:DNA-entry nuclease [Bacillus wiedmannii]|uniref:DNA-entry nuclease n=1 Tax=Bacillus wiedmannii TaxID=1890302 RepID=UPI003D99580C
MEVQYDAQGRMKYHPDYHPNHKKPYTTRELAYICKYYGFGKVKGIALSLGRTETTIRQLVNVLRNNGTFENNCWIHILL